MTKAIYEPYVKLFCEPKIEDGFIEEFAKRVFREGVPETAVIKKMFNKEEFVFSDAVRLVEFAGRHCYRSWDKGRTTSHYIKNIIEQDHNSVLRHAHFSFQIEGISRNLSLEHNRHYTGVDLSQESQRYVKAEDINYIVHPTLVKTQAEAILGAVVKDCIKEYKEILEILANENIGNDYVSKHKMIMEAARNVLPGCVETRMVWSANVQTLRHYFEKRGSMYADPEIRNLAIKIFDIMVERHRIFFFDFQKKYEGENIWLEKNNL